jgi:transcriptional regulator GlxA family with amidase domain
MKPIRIGLLGYDGVQALDLIGPSDAFSIATVEGEDRQTHAGYEVFILGLTGKPFVAESGVVFQPQRTLRPGPVLDTLIIPGGKGVRLGKSAETIATWIATHAHKIRRIASVCTGIYALARTGLLDGRQVTTHWRFADDLSKRFPKLNVDHNALFLKDGPFYTSGGITASVDLTLALIEEDYGPRVALAVARELVVFLKRSGGQKQYSEPLEFQISSTDRFADLASWMLGHLRHDLSLEVLAERACLSPRHFTRRFKDVFGGTPAVFVENLRLDEARRRLTERTQTIENVAASVGFNSDDAFRRAFQRRFGVKPSSYRKRFELRANGSSHRELLKKTSKRPRSAKEKGRRK